MIKILFTFSIIFLIVACIFYLVSTIIVKIKTKKLIKTINEINSQLEDNKNV